MLTEESGFAGGMFWTNNNIDETHLKAVVNCDYDETTGYLKTRDPFVQNEKNEGDTPPIEFFQEHNVSLKNQRLLGVYSICAFDMDNDETTLAVGKLYLFTTAPHQKGFNTIPINALNLTAIYHSGDDYYKCSLDVEETVTLSNVIEANTLINYENQLYGLGTDTAIEESWLQVYRIEYSADSGYCFKQLRDADYVKPKIDAITLLEASVSGFNAARGKETFTYNAISSDKAGELPYILGVYITEYNKDTEKDGPVLVSPAPGQLVRIHVPTVYEAADKASYLSMFQLKEVSDTTATTNLEDSWNPIATSEAENGEFVFEFKFQKKKTTLGFTFYGTTNPGETPAAYSDNAVDYLMPYVVTTSDNKSNLKVKNYNLNSAIGSCVWRNHLCVWGTEGSTNCLFFSDVDNFFYYPVPNNIALFDTSVISCIPYKDTLLVFTSDKIYRVSEDNSGAFVQTVVQNDMPLSKEDSAHLTAIKNMVLFKSGNYFYMIVPKSQSLTDELTIAPIYKNIAGFLNTLDKSTQEVLQLMYPENLYTECEINNNAPSAVYSEQDTIHILYDVVCSVKEIDTLNTKPLLYKMFLNYNTNLRAWTLYIEDTTTASLEVAYLTTTRTMAFVRIHNDKYGTFSIVEQKPVATQSNLFRILIDTGYRSLSTTIQKRFREVQLKLYNSTESITAFGTAFLIDGMWRRNYSKLQETLLDDNVVSLMPTLDLNTFVAELSMPISETGDIVKDPGSDAIELSDWTLDFSHFKRESPITIRIPVSGKGYNPRFIFMTPNATGLIINEINWVYRLMHGR